MKHPIGHPDHLKTLTTRELLHYLQKARACGGGYDPTDNHSNVYYTIEQIKAELATREHIPNKPEGRVLRRKAATKKAKKNKFIKNSKNKN